MTDTTINPNRALWEKGDFTRLAATMRDSGDALIATLDVGPGMDVLDLGCGDGTTALPSARRGARVLGVDIASNLRSEEPTSEPPSLMRLPYAVIRLNN